MTRAIPKEELEPALRATLSRRAFTHVLQYATRGPLDLINCHCAPVLRAKGTFVEVWATDAIAQAAKVKNLICATGHFAAMARRCGIIFRMPDCRAFLLHWETDIPVGALQGEVLYMNAAVLGAGLPPQGDCGSIGCATRRRD